MSVNQKGHHRRSIRLQGYDYSHPGAYFVTICSYQRRPVFGDITRGELHLNQAGQIVWDVWKSLPERYPHIELGAAMVMPNHFHGIIVIRDDFSHQAISRGNS